MNRGGKVQIDHWIRDLRWVLSSPFLMNPSGSGEGDVPAIPNIGNWEINEQQAELFTEKYSGHRVGYHFENLIYYWLKQRGMLDETLVLWGGEFGRTPTVELAGGKSKLGRDHNHYGFSVWMAGGGIKGGTVYGATDEFGFKAVENPVSVHDLHATMLHLLGLDHEQLTYRYAGRDFRLTDVSGKVLHDIIA